MSIIINPGSGPVPGATEANAALNVAAFAEEVSERYGIAVVALTRYPEIDDGDGRFGYRLAMADERQIDVEMPGLSLDRVRYTGEDAQDIWDYPRLYIDGSSWVWKFAVDVCEPES